MKKYILLLFVSLFLISCDKDEYIIECVEPVDIIKDYINNNIKSIDIIEISDCDSIKWVTKQSVEIINKAG